MGLRAKRVEVGSLNMAKPNKEAKIKKIVDSIKKSLKPTYYVSYSDFDELVKAFYGVKDYNGAAVMESGNDTSYDYHIDGDNELDREDIEDWAQGNEPTFGDPWPVALLNDMAHKGVIPTGHYVYTVSW